MNSISEAKRRIYAIAVPAVFLCMSGSVMAQGSISGTVYESDGTTAVTQGLVLLYGDTNGTLVDTTALGAGGTYTFSGLAAASFKLLVLNPPLGLAPEYYGSTHDYDLAATIPVGPSENVTDIDFTLDPGGAVCGYVYKTNGVTALTNINVHAWPAGSQNGGFNDDTDGTGYYYIQLGVGNHVLQARGTLGYISEYYMESYTWNLAEPVQVTAGTVVSNVNFTLALQSTISGRVFQNDGFTPIGNCWVDAFLQGAQLTPWHADVSTGGIYSITNLPAGDYILRVGGLPLGFAPEWYDGFYHSGICDYVPVGEEEAVANIDFTVEPGGAIEGHVYETNGITPITNEQVQAWQTGSIPEYTGEAGNYDPVDTDGYYYIQLPVGNHTVRAGGGSSWVPEYYQESADMGGSTPVTVNQGIVTTGIDFTLAESATISGFVYEQNGVTPVRSGWVSAQRADGRQEDHWEGLSQVQTDGTYLITGLSGGDYKLRVGDVPLGAVPEYYDGESDWDNATVVSLSATQVLTNVNFTLEPGGAIAGYVYLTNGTPIQDQYVCAQTEDNLFWDGDKSDSNGFYYILLPLGTYIVDVDGHPKYIREYYSETTEWRDAQRVTVANGTVTFNINFTMAYGGAVSGHVYQTDGTTPVTSAWVSAIRTIDGNDLKGTDVEPDGSYWLTGLPAGDYKLKITDTPLGFAPEYYDGASSLEAGTPITVVPETTVTGIDFTLDAGGAISGHVYEEDGTTPIENAEVGAWPPGSNGDGGEWTWTDSDGYYGLRVNAGDWVVWADGAPTYAREYYHEQTDENSAQTLNVGEGSVVSNIDFTLDMAGSISGYVYEEDGTTPIASGDVNAMSENDHNWLGGTSIQPDGSYTINGLTADNYKIQIWNPPLGFAPEYYDGVRDYDDANVIALGAGGVISNINFTLDPGGGICGYVYDTNGIPIENENVDAESITEESNYGTSTDSNGYYELTVAVGTFKVEAGGNNLQYAPEYYNDKSGWNSADPVVVSAGQMASNINFSLPDAALIAGRVTQGDGVTPIPYIGVWARPTNDIIEQTAETEADSDGYYTLSVPQGTYYVVSGEDDGYGVEIYDESTHISSGTPVTATEGTTVSNVDFTLDPAGAGWIHADLDPDWAQWLIEVPWGELHLLQGDLGPMDLLTGVYTIVWQPVAGWALPTNNPASLSILEGQTGSVSGVYSPFDTDNDDMYDWEEIIAGTGTNDINDFFDIDSIVADAGGNHVILWQCHSGRWYSVYSRTALTNSGWTTEAYRRQCLSDGVMSYTNSGGGTRCFYRIGVRNQ